MAKRNDQDNNKIEIEQGIHTDFIKNMTYAEYLKLDAILTNQNRLSENHDEMLFIIIHQVSELWMKLILHELNAAIDCIEENELLASYKCLARVSRTQTQMIQTWDVLSTLTPAEYLQFRDSLGRASGFQSYQHRLIEFAFGYKTSSILQIYEKEPEIKNKLKLALQKPSIYDASIRALIRAGFDIKKGSSDYSKPYEESEAVKQAWLTVYQNVERYWELYQLAEKLIDIEDSFHQWRYRHMKTVERIIGFKKGTGGSSGVAYLKKVLDQRFFPELWDVRTEL
ncbi:tryptophan 2,3-dioxygenase [Halalkalibacter akibai]|uniref:Tryptophan 2,3-dioxygenase n=1 Tax=Halalkalibacter akibai (strain ATCC 43226 / DSM 21942 / CIP 109018 / JCM 9157 / 1139) TaxID=1236973 RepID=W4QUB4_HALA3|nr:tryptophan 2,3-dioxygenase [Halalkalibacter akibai]GAE35208.1 tryptophan 2,3-dioxygenase [Halalkalibacter akibai JCM 9157]